MSRKDITIERTNSGKKRDFKALMLRIKNNKFRPRIFQDNEWLAVSQEVAKEHWARQQIFGVARYSICKGCKKPTFEGAHCLECKKKKKRKDAPSKETTKSYKERNKEEGEEQRKLVHNERRKWPDNFSRQRIKRIIP